MGESSSGKDILNRELYFLIIKFLSDGPCSSAAQALKLDVERHKLLPNGINWLGEETPHNFQDTERNNQHIPNDYLKKICSRLLPLLEETIPPSVKGVRSLLGAGRHSLLRPSQDSGGLLTSDQLTVCRHGIPLAPGYKTKKTFSLTNVVEARQLSGTSGTSNFLHHGIYTKISMHCRILGHLSAVYCVLFDQTGQSIITGADDNLVKIWSSSDGRLLATLRGLSAEVSDIAINCENTLLAAGSCDKTIRVWNIHTSAPVGVLQGHTGTITSLQFSPSSFNETRYLMSTGGDASVSFWTYNLLTNEFDPTPIKFQEKSRPGAQIICSSFSPGGTFLVTGNTDHNIRVYQINPGPPERIAELNAHLDHVDSIQFSHSSERFLSGSRDGTARIWYFQRSEWKSYVLNSQQQLSNSPQLLEDDNKIVKIRVTMVGWDLWDQFVITAVNDHTIKVWESNTGNLIYILKGHQDEVFVIEAHPTDPHLLLTAGHDGYIILWNLDTGTMVKSFHNLLEGQGHGAVFDCKFSPDGQKFATTDSHGYLGIYGFGSNEPYQKVPEEQFFHTDYRPVMRDINNHVLDEQSQTVPHLMPPPFLVDVDGNPHPIYYQRLIPGHSSNIRPRRQITSPPPVPSSPLPPLLAQIEQFEREAMLPNPDVLRSPSNENNAVPPLASPGIGSRNRGLLQDGDIEGVRQLNVNIPIVQDATEADINAWRNRTIVPKLRTITAKSDDERRLAVGRQELMKYLKEKKKRPLPSTSRPANQTDKKAEKFLRSRALRLQRRNRASRPPEPRPVYNTRAITINDISDESGDEDIVISPSESEDEDGDEAWNNSSSESSEYSDWTEEVGLVTRQQSENQRPSRRVRRVLSSSDEEGESSSHQPHEGDEEQEETPTVKRENDRSRKSTKKKKKQARNKPRPDQKDEWLAYHRPPEWMTSTKLRRSPYIPQVGDEVYYFKQGHKMYVNEVQRQDAYDINPKKQCFTKLDLKAEELCKVVSLHCVVGPPTLMSLKLAILNPESGANTGGTFTVKYHDMADVLDFFVLKQQYEQSLQREWHVGSRFRSVIDDCWWSGVITEDSPYEDEHADSSFLRFYVSWDTGEVERMSPWDLELPCESELAVFEEPDDNTSNYNNIPVTDEEQEILAQYSPQELDWPDEDYDDAIARITRGLSLISELSFAGPFAYPVDVDTYQDYWTVVAYPVDLKTINDRLINKYYRRKTALLWDICQTGRNAKAYNEEDSEIVQNAEKLVSVMTRFIKDPTCHDPLSLCEDLTVENGDVDVENVYESDVEGETPERGSRENKRKHIPTSPSPVRKKTRRSTNTRDEANVEEYSLNRELLALLNMLSTRSDAEPFREPVDLEEFPDYLEYVEERIDFSIIRQRIEDSYYNEPDEFISDIRLVFSNSRKYNTNPKSRIYSMTLRVSALFENNVEELLLNFYRHRTGGGRRTRQRYHAPMADDQPGPSGISNPPSSQAETSVVTTRSTTSTRSTVPTNRVTTRRQSDSGAGPSHVPAESLRMRISLATGSVVSTSGLGDMNRIEEEPVASTSTRQRETTQRNNVPSTRVTTRSRASASSVSSVQSSVQSSVPDTPTSVTQNGHMTRYSTRSRVPNPRYEVNGVSDTAEQESEEEDEEEEEEEEEEESEEESENESSDTSVVHNRRSTRSTARTSVNKKNSSNKGKQAASKRRASENEERGRSQSRHGLRTRIANAQYNDSASDSDDERSSNRFLSVSSRGRVRRKAARMVDYVN